MKLKEFEALTLPRPDPGDGYKLGAWVFYRGRYKRGSCFWTIVWKDGVLPPPNSAVRAPLHVYKDDLERCHDLDALVRIKVESARMACDDYLRRTLTETNARSDSDGED